MDSIIQDKEAPFPHTCPQRPFLWDHFPLLFPNLFYPFHQNLPSPTIPPGLLFLFFFKFYYYYNLFSPFTCVLCMCILRFNCPLLLLLLQLDVSLFLGIEVGQSFIIDDPAGPFTVTAFDANHCPGNLFNSVTFISSKEIAHFYFNYIYVG